MIRLENVVRSYQMGEVQVRALRGLNLEIKEGEFVAIMGPSGSGKSTLLHLIGALDLPNGGTVKLGDLDISEQNSSQLAELRGKKMGFIFQTFNLITTLSALENVELPMMFQGIPRGKRRKRSQKLLEQVGLGDRSLHRPTELSGGEQQRVAIARALVNDPDIILADEPTGNLDSKSGAEIMQILSELNQNRGVTVIMVTHNSEDAQYADRIAHIRDGRIKGHESLNKEVNRNAY